MASASDPAIVKKRYLRLLIFLGIVTACGYLLLTRLSWQFVVVVLDNEKPTLAMLAIYAFLFVCYWIALAVVVRLPASKLLLTGTVCAACLFRVIQLPSVPIHEIDIYRYIWDGAVLASGTSPYRYSPLQVKQATEDSSKVDEKSLSKLVDLQNRSESLAFSLNQIHFAELTSPYPPVSQAVFAMAAMVTPDRASQHTRMVIMKFMLVLFDLGTLLVVVLLLREANLHPGLNIAYGWCPLVMKEIANGGHLDSIAIFLCSLSILFLIRSVNRPIHNPALATIVFPSVTLAMAIAAKLYPVLLLPLFVAFWWRQINFRRAAIGFFSTIAATVILLWPLIHADFTAKNMTEKQFAEEIAQADENFDDEPSVARSSGLQTFFKRWEMNDLLFMIVLENLKSQADVAANSKPWFVLIPDNWSSAIVAHTASAWNYFFDNQTTESQLSESMTHDDIAFLLSRIITLGGFSIFACWVSWRTAAKNNAISFCRAAFLILAWFWLTCPTQNPWYWCWVLPFLPFVNLRSWYLVAGFSMLYYLRFWLTAHFPDPHILGTPYNGEYFFYFVLVWIEFIPCLILLGIEWFYSSQNESAHFAVHK